MSSFLENIPATQYFERHSDSLFAEPFNALSNIAFFVAAYLIHRFVSRIPKEDRGWECRVLPALLVVVGVGSLLFHTARNGYTFLCDVVPIAVFILLAMFSLLRWLTGSVGRSIALVAVFIAVEAVIPKRGMSGSLPYVAALATLLLITVGAFRGRGVKASPLLILCLLFGMAIVFRSVDLASGAIFPMGTHWIWHIFAAASSYVAARFVIQTKQNRP